MGITVAYRGRLDDLTRVEDFEDRLVDFALEIGGLAQIWRSCADDKPERMVRGVILNLTPGLESTSMLLSPEGWLIGLTDIEDAELGALAEPPWCFTKTQFGPLEGHVALVEMLIALRREFLPDLEVKDEGGYYESHDLAELARRHGAVGQAIEGLAEGLRRHGLSPEAAEDPDILVKRIERIAAQVHRVLRRPAEHPPVTFPEDEGYPPDLEATEAAWDEMFKHNRRQQERMNRSIEERRSQGEEEDEAFENALGDLGLEPPTAAADAEDEPWQEDEDSFDSFDADVEADPLAAEESDEDDMPFADRNEPHPLLRAAMDVLHELHTAFEGADQRFEPSLRTLFQGAGDAMGGLAQALSGRREEEEEDDDLDNYGLRVTQLKRALRGAAFAAGALFPLRPAVTPEKFKELYATLRRMEKDIFQELARLRAKHGAGGDGD